MIAIQDNSILLLLTVAKVVKINFSQVGSCNTYAGNFNGFK